MRNIPPIDGFHIHHISDICPINTHSNKVGLVNYSLPMLCVFLYFLFVTQPVRITFKPFGPFCRPLSSMLLDCSGNRVQTLPNWNIPVFITKLQLRRQLPRQTKFEGVKEEKAVSIFHLDHIDDARSAITWTRICKASSLKQVNLLKTIRYQ